MFVELLTPSVVWGLQTSFSSERGSTEIAIRTQLKFFFTTRCPLSPALLENLAIFNGLEK